MYDKSTKRFALKSTGESKPADDEHFFKHPQGIDGLNPACKPCSHPGNSTVMSIGIPVAENSEDSKKCTLCGLTFPRNTACFYVQKNSRDGLHNWCRGCCKKKNASNYEGKKRGPVTKIRAR